ncbi:MAG: hypothetical protein H7A25_15845 [Leptospiraceae bacterium]|nr:hypothetical protein [Leptospiraceae bacterium]
MKCSNHTEKDADGACVYCGKLFCSDCLVEVEGKNYCKQDIGKVFKEASNKTDKRSEMPMVFMNAGGGGAAASASSSSSSGNSHSGRYIHWGMFLALLLCTGGIGLIFYPLWYKSR